MARQWIEIKAGETYVGKNGQRRKVVEYNPRTMSVRYLPIDGVRDPQERTVNERTFKNWAVIERGPRGLQMQVAEEEA